ncbi:class I SAM-dependent methyltransferase [Kitasatospora sp. NPDC049258]|uniref:class I SAM-dependent DNA methyltransferase n=1 Tax=Kitasatospora sp. NPDC049258 TaxID=3155394 RepID=UPI00342CAB27
MFDYLARTMAAYENGQEKYEQATRAMTPGAELDRFVALLPGPPGAPVLDAGCAFGRDTALLAERGLDVLGGDLSPSFVARARELHPGLAFEQLDVCALRLPDASYAGVWCQATLLHLRDEHIALALGEFARVLVPGGAVFVSFKEGEGTEELVESFSSDGTRFFNYQSVAGVRTLLAAAGFTVLAVERENELARYGPGHRDLTWLHAFAVKAGGAAPAEPRGQAPASSSGSLRMSSNTTVPGPASRPAGVTPPA